MNTLTKTLCPKAVAGKYFAACALTLALLLAFLLTPSIVGAAAPDQAAPAVKQETAPVKQETAPAPKVAPEPKRHQIPIGPTSEPINPGKYGPENLRRISRTELLPAEPQVEAIIPVPYPTPARK